MLSRNKVRDSKWGEDHRKSHAGRPDQVLPPSVKDSLKSKRSNAAPTREMLEADPELWWKERLRLQRLNRGDWSQVGGIGGTVRTEAVRDPQQPANQPLIQNGQASIQAGAESETSSYTFVKAPWYEDQLHPGGQAPPPYLEPGSGISRWMRGLVRRTVVAVLLFGAVWGWFRYGGEGHELAKAWVRQAVTQDMDFAAVEAWYGRTFGDSPSFLPVFRHGSDSEAEEVSAAWRKETTVIPVAGRIVETFAQNGGGIRMAAPNGSPVSAVHTGRVTQVTISASGLATILIQHANYVVSVYGNVDTPLVKTNDWVEAGQKLGTLEATSGGQGGEGILYFTVKQNGKTLDPTEVIPFD